MKVSKGYSLVQITLHWLLAGLVLINFLLADAAGQAFDIRFEGAGPEAAGLPLHVIVGAGVFVMTLFRLWQRHSHGVPAQDPGLQGLLAHLLHLVLYGLLLVVPLLGTLTWWTGSETLAGLHGFLAGALLLLVVGHAGMALYHHYVLKDDTLRRMTRPE